MSIKLVLLKSGEQVVSDVKELVSEESVRGYVFKKPHKVQVNRTILLTEDESAIGDRNIEITLSPWVLLTNDEDILVSPDWIVTIVDPLNSIIEMYEEKVNGQVD
jgi:hypothetical protein